MSLKKSYQNASHKIYKKSHGKNLKIHQYKKTRTHFEMGIACVEDWLLGYSKDSRKEETEKPHLKLAKPAARTKMGVLQHENLQENNTRGELRLRGREG